MDADNSKEVIESNIINSIIKSFLNIKEITNSFLSLSQNQINNLSSISYNYYYLLKSNNNKIENKYENEIKNLLYKELKDNIKESIFKKRNNYEKIMEIITSSLNINNLLDIKKQIIEECKNCGYTIKERNFNTNFLSFSTERYINNNKDILLSDIFVSIEYFTKCKKCKENKYLQKSVFLSIPEILIIIIKDNTKKIIYPKTNFSIKYFIRDEKLQKFYI